MPDPIDELRQQRALVAAHLAWLDKQIAAAAGEVPPQAAPPPPASPPNAGTTIEADANVEAEAIIAQYRDEAASSPVEIKRGCLLAFAILMTLTIGGVFAVYWFRYRP